VTSARADRIGFVAEDFDFEEGGRLTGLFSAHWESDTDDRSGPGPEGVPVEEAIEWARRHAARVSVLLYDDETMYSAGEVPYSDLPPWPEGGMVLRPRPMGAPRDGSVQEIPWRVKCVVALAHVAAEEEQAQLRAAITADARVTHVESTVRGRRLIVELDCTARGSSAACIGAHKLVSAALAVVPPDAVLLSAEVLRPALERPSP
jgi:hypothetical protein